MGSGRAGPGRSYSDFSSKPQRTRSRFALARNNHIWILLLFLARYSKERFNPYYWWAFWSTLTGGGGAILPPVRSRELTSRFRWDKGHSIPLIVNFQNHYKKVEKVENWGSWKQIFLKISRSYLITKIAITSLFFVQFWWNLIWSFLIDRAFTYIPVFWIFKNNRQCQAADFGVHFL